MWQPSRDSFYCCIESLASTVQIQSPKWRGARGHARYLVDPTIRPFDALVIGQQCRDGEREAASRRLAA
jgi:hypothetical protein